MKLLKFSLFAFVLVAAILAPFRGDAAMLSDKLRGYLLLQVEQHGEAWYVNPSDGLRYYMKDGPAAFEVMRRTSLGISNNDLAALHAGNVALKARLKGWILLQVESHGEAWYVCPRTGTVSYMRDGAAAYTIMSQCGLGIRDSDLALVPAGSLSELLPVSAGSAMIAGCSVFPADNPWNRDISNDPVHPSSATYIASIGAIRGLHPDFGADQDYGIPYTAVSASQPKVPITFTAYGDESDPGPYPIPANAKREQGSDAHVLVLDKDNCKLYELFNASKDTTGTGWSADAGAIYDLHSNALRPEGWTSADAAGLPILPGLVRYDEVAAGEIRHAIRFTTSQTQNGWIHPAVHQAGSNSATYPPMGLRVRLKKNFDTIGFSGQALVILTAMKKYGMILADNGSSWFFTGATDPGWNDDQLNQLKSVPGNAFEAVYTGDINK